MSDEAGQGNKELLDALTRVNSLLEEVLEERRKREALMNLFGRLGESTLTLNKELIDISLNVPGCPTQVRGSVVGALKRQDAIYKDLAELYGEKHD
jgi:hypothetical protein